MGKTAKHSTASAAPRETAVHCDKLAMQNSFSQRLNFTSANVQYAMASIMDTLPEELILRVFNDLEQLVDLYAVMFTCKRFHRISQDVKARKISQLFLRSGNYFPALRPISHFFLVASAGRLSEWAREDEDRQTKLNTAMHGGMTELAALAAGVAPIDLDDIRAVWAWKRDTVMSLTRRFDLTCGPLSRGPAESHLTVCEGTEIALLSWAIYGELFAHVTCLDWLESTAKLHSVTRFKFLMYCVPDINSFSYMGLESPQWFKDLGNASAESYQQLSLSKAIDEELNYQAFRDDIRQLMDPNLPMDDYDPEPSTCSRAGIFVHTVMNSGCKSLEVLKAAEVARRGEQSDSEALIKWLWDTWTLVQQSMGPNSQHEDEGRSLRLAHTADPWLNRHIPSMNHDLRFTLWNDLQYEYRADATTSEEDLEKALKLALTL